MIDIDAHIAVNERTWEHIANRSPASGYTSSQQGSRPLHYTSPDEPGMSRWYLDGKSIGAGLSVLADPTLSDDRKVRIDNMDRANIETELLQPVLWHRMLTEREEVEVTLAASTNLWLASVAEGSNNRIRWTAAIPTLNATNGANEVLRSAELGASAIGLRAVDGHRMLSDPHFHPIYAAAERCGLPVVVHASNGSPDLLGLMAPAYGDDDGFAADRISLVGACFGLVLSDVPSTFPKLRWGFTGMSSHWVSWIVHHAERLRAKKLEGPDSDGGILESNNVWVSCTPDDDFAYVRPYLDPSHIMLGSAHAAGETDAFKALLEREDVDSSLGQQVTSANAKSFLGI